jgi:hypothetical protein
MRDRCLNPNYKQWSDYGGRGISICPEWTDYRTFERDMSPRPKGASIDRIDPNGNYEPVNCRWTTRKEQQRNQRRTIFVTVGSTRYKAIELAEQSGLKVETIVKRASLGMTYEQVTTKTRYAGGRWQKAVAVRVANQRAQTHCKHGHEFTPENTGTNSVGNRFCRHCHRLKVARQRAKSRQMAKFFSKRKRPSRGSLGRRAGWC